MLCRGQQTFLLTQPEQTLLLTQPELTDACSGLLTQPELTDALGCWCLYWGEEKCTKVEVVRWEAKSFRLGQLQTLWPEESLLAHLCPGAAESRSELQER